MILLGSVLNENPIKLPAKGKRARTGRPPKHSVSKGSHFFSGTGEAEILKPTASQSLNSIEDSNTRESRAEDFGSQNDNQTPTRRRVRKPNSLMKPEEGYDLTWISAERRSDKTPCQVKPSKKRTGRPPKHSVSMGDFSSLSQSLNSIQDLSSRESCAGEENKLSGETSKKSKRKCSPSEKAARPLAEELVGCRIKAWDPKDKMFYEGSITSYDKSENKHRINCDDGSVKDMNLSVERWEPIRDDADTFHNCFFDFINQLWSSRALEVTKWSLNLLEKFFDTDAYHLVLSLSFDSMATDNSPQEQSESPPWAEPLSEIRQQLENHSHYHLQTMQALQRIDLPKFDGKDPHAWIFQSQEFFEYHNVPPGQRLSRVAFMVHGEALEWFRWMKSNSLLRSWDDFLEQVKLRFDPLYFEDFTGRLSKLQQITTVAAYRAEYEKILNKVTNVPETVLISMFIAGLKSTIRREVQRARPQTLVQTFRHPSNSNPLPVLSMTPAEKQAKLSRGECYTCNSKWTKNHKCPNRALLLFCSEDEAVAEQNETVDDQSLSGDISSLNSMAGPGTPRSLRLQGVIDGKPVRVLIDGRSTHNFIQPAVAEQLHLQVKSIPPFQVYIGNGDSLRCTVNCEQVPLYLNGTLFPVDLFVIPIKGPEIVLGVQWLQDLGDITHNYAKVSMEFSWLGKNVQLLGDTTPLPLEISAAHLHSLLLKDEVHGCFELFSIEAKLTHKEFAWPTDIPLEVQYTLEKFEPLFSEPSSLPPHRLQDHKIHLIPGSKPVNTFDNCFFDFINQLWSSRALEVTEWSLNLLEKFFDTDAYHEILKKRIMKL
nr:uncharacterized protein LOC112097934 [Ipomoea trifida]